MIENADSCMYVQQRIGACVLAINIIAVSSWGQVHVHPT